MWKPWRPPNLFSASPPGPTSITFVGRLGKPSPPRMCRQNTGQRSGRPGSLAPPWRTEPGQREDLVLGESLAPGDAGILCGG